MDDNSGTVHSTSAEGTVGTHAPRDTQPFRTAPTTGTDFNTLGLDIVSLGCLSLNDILFAFDSSFINKDAVKMLEQLPALREKHKNSKGELPLLSVFGHADPVGKDEYNKTLSGRRVRAVYALMTHNVDMWLSLLHAPFGGDDWTAKKALDSMREALSDTANRPAAAVITDYQKLLCPMPVAPADFLGKGADKAGAADYQGCSDFNPVIILSKSDNATLSHEDRNAANQPDRRVVVFLFSADTKINPSLWPCPKSNEPAGKCRTRFFADSKTRLAPGAQRRERRPDLAKNTDPTADKKTFACRFYDRIAGGSPCETLPYTFQLRWEPAKGVCGDTVKLLGFTDVFEGGSVNINIVAKQGESKAIKPVVATVTGGAIEAPFKIADVSFSSGKTFLDQVELEAQPEGGMVTGDPPILTVQALLDTNEETTTIPERHWSGFTLKPKFTMKVEKFRCKVHPAFDIMKMWAAYRVDLSGFKVTGTVTNGPNGNGLRWARVTGTNPMMPDQYYDGKKWVAIPAGFAAAAGTNSSIYTAVGFYKSGSNFVPQSGGGGGSFPTPFPDYDFNSTANTAKRNTWIKVTHDKWTDVFPIRRKDCPSAPKTRCCIYDVEVNITFNVVTSDADGVIAVCEGSLRSNAGIWFMGDTRDDVAAHETGHHMDNPDEYTGGAVDPTVNGDGAVNGIDADSIMGQNLTKVKKRHVHAFNTILATAIKNKYGRDYTYEAVDK